MSDPKLDITEHFVRACAREVAERAKLALAKHASVPPALYLACRVSPLDGTPLDTSTSVVPVIHGGDYSSQSKQSTIMAARAIAIAGDAMACIICMNSWAVVEPNEELQKKLHADIIAGTARLDEHPNRREILFVAIEWLDYRVEVVATLSCVRDQGFVDFDEMPELSEAREINGAMRILHPTNPPPPAEVVDAAREFARHTLIDKRVAMREAAEAGRIARG